MFGTYTFDNNKQCIFYKKLNYRLQCNTNPNNVFPEKELRGLSPNFHIHVSVSDLYIGPHKFLQQNRQTDRGNL
jgi:hypothetical protein